MARIWERAVRKVQLPIAYSEGFSPRAKLSFGLALPTVFESAAEFVDLTFDTPVPAEGLAELLTPVMPDGIVVSEVVALEGKVDSLQECVESTEWQLFVDAELADLSAWAERILAADELMLTRERKGKKRTDDVRPAVLDVTASPSTDESVLATTVVTAHLAAKPRALRPLELLDLDNRPGTFVLGRRINQYIAPIGARRDPLAVGAAEAPHSSNPLSCVS